MRRFLEFLRLFKRLNDEPEIKSFSATGETLGASRLDNPLLSKADEHDVAYYN